MNARERERENKREKKRKEKKEGKWKAGIKTKGGEDVVCDGGDAPFFRDAATYRRARAALKGFTCAELLCCIASRVMVSKEHEIFFCYAHVSLTFACPMHSLVNSREKIQRSILTELSLRGVNSL